MAPSEWARYRSGADVGKALSSKTKWWIFVAIRLLQVPVSLAAIAVAEWTIKTKLANPPPTVWMYGLVCGCVTTPMLFYLVPATLSNRVPGAGHGGFVPPILDFLAMILWAGSWISLDQVERGISCSGVVQDTLCLPYIAFKALGCWNFSLCLLMGMISTAKWYKAWKDPRMDRFGLIEGNPYGSDGLPTFTLPTDPRLRSRFGDTMTEQKQSELQHGDSKALEAENVNNMKSHE